MTRRLVRLHGFEATTLRPGLSTTLLWRPQGAVRLVGLIWKGAHDNAFVSSMQVGMSSLFAGPGGASIDFFRADPPLTNFAWEMAPGHPFSVVVRNDGAELAAELEVWGLEAA